MRKFAGVAVAVLALAAAPAAQAEAWGIYLGTGPGWGWHGNPYRPVQDWRVQQVCSGERARQLEQRLAHEVDEGELDGWQASRIHAEIDRQERAQSHECAEGDWGAIARIASRYDRIQDWIGRSAHGWGRGGWRP